MRPTPKLPPAERILTSVVGIIEEKGVDALVLEDVARRAQTSLATIYKNFPSRDDLISAAVEYWMRANIIESVADVPPKESLFDALKEYIRHIFGPWEESPRMAEAYMRVRLWPSQKRLQEDLVPRAAQQVQDIYAHLDPEFVDELTILLTNFVYGLLYRFASGEIPVTEIVPTTERTISWLASFDLSSTT
jgi:AcrR family transcriptional regulator